MLAINLIHRFHIHHKGWMIMIWSKQIHIFLLKIPVPNLLP